ncbi:hypothetical protein CEXT_184231 [Caerostris extrusa]|uniref:Uncharacterized protein n=1 Tax=Caerostris extrusa TaxID=172846 RepID=A0AAV4S1H8_CAEEX|nr:hypothetical protein CEXT_184231 [Caerostris extrusa]
MQTDCRSGNLQIAIGKRTKDGGRDPVQHSFLRGPCIALFFFSVCFPQHLRGPAEDMMDCDSLKVGGQLKDSDLFLPDLDFDTEVRSP